MVAACFLLRFLFPGSASTDPCNQSVGFGTPSPVAGASDAFWAARDEDSRLTAKFLTSLIEAFKEGSRERQRHFRVGNKQVRTHSSGIASYPHGPPSQLGFMDI